MMMDREDRIKLMEASVETFLTDIRIRKWVKKVELIDKESLDSLDIETIRMEIDSEIAEIVRKAKEEADRVSP